MKLVSTLIVGLLLAPTLVGCQTTGSTPSGTDYSVFFTPSDHIKQLIEENKLQEADSVFRSEQEFFSPKKESDGPKNPLATLFSGTLQNETEKSVPERLADAIQKLIEPKANRAIESLPSNEDWPTEISEWKSVESAISRAEDVIGEYDGYAVFNDEGRQPKTYSQLKRRLSSLKVAVNESLDELFEGHSLANSIVFFDQFPIKSGLINYLDDKEVLWRSKITGVPVSEFARVFNDYKPWLSDQLQQEMGGAVF